MRSSVVFAPSRRLGDRVMRWSVLVAVLLICAAALGGAVWIRASLASSFKSGEALGRAEVEAQVAAALAERNAALEAVRSASERDVATLEIERDQLKDRLDDLEKAVTAREQNNSRRDNGRLPCLDAGVVRALDAIRRKSVTGAP
jgi:hypothetical protein